MLVSIDTASYKKACSLLQRLVGKDATCSFSVSEKGSSFFTSSSLESWIKVPVKLNSAEGFGSLTASVEHFSVISQKSSSFELKYTDGSEIVEIRSGRTKGQIRLSDGEIEKPTKKIDLTCQLPVKQLLEATEAVAFKPVVDASAPCAILKVIDKAFSLSSYDSYVGTHFRTDLEESAGDFSVSLDMEFWKLVIRSADPQDNIAFGVDGEELRIKCSDFDLYRCSYQSEDEDVSAAIESVRGSNEIKSVLSFDTKAALESLAETRSLLSIVKKDDARYKISVSPNAANVTVEGAAGKMETSFDLQKAEGESAFEVNAALFGDLLKLANSGAGKNGPSRLTCFGNYLILESQNSCVKSLFPTMQG